MGTTRWCCDFRFVFRLESLKSAVDTLTLVRWFKLHPESETVELTVFVIFLQLYQAKLDVGVALLSTHRLIWRDHKSHVSTVAEGSNNNTFT